MHLFLKNGAKKKPNNIDAVALLVACEETNP